ncbi:hypothetical protein, partial [Bradyrhizobium sp. 153]|uniref:hypothetical protein n=1 Tax=Bradyrhizobium sp. 153 TaxID=2782627 RepID=UPI001FF7C420
SRTSNRLTDPADGPSKWTSFLLSNPISNLRPTRGLLRTAIPIPNQGLRLSAYDVANGMDTEDGVIWVYGIGDDQVMAFTDFGIENLTELIRMHKEDPELLKRWNR